MFSDVEQQCKGGGECACVGAGWGFENDRRFIVDRPA